jgi:CHAT domain-containing protein
MGALDLLNRRRSKSFSSLLAIASAVLLLGEFGLILKAGPSIAKQGTPLCGDSSIQTEAQRLTRLPSGEDNEIGEFLVLTSRARILREQGKYIESLKCSLSIQDFLVHKVAEVSRPPLQAINSLQLYNTYVLLGDLKAAQSAINVAIAFAEWMDREKIQQDTSREDLRSSIYLKASQAYYTDDRPKSFAFIVKGVKFLPKIDNSSPLSIASAYTSFADQFAQMGMTELAIEHYSGAGLVYQNLKLEATPEYATILTNLARQYSIQGKHAKSELFLHGAFLNLSKNGKGLSEDAQRLKLMQAVVFSQRGQAEKALETLDELIKEGVSQKQKNAIMLEAILGKAYILKDKQDTIAFDKLFLGVVPKLQPNLEAYKDSSPDIVVQLKLLVAGRLLEGGKLQEAKGLAIQAFLLSIDKLGSRNPITTQVASFLAGIDVREGNFTKGNKLYGSVLDSAIDQGSKILEAQTWADLARLEFARKNYSLALAHGEKAGALLLAYTAMEISRMPKADRLKLYDQYSEILDFQQSLIKFNPEALRSSFDLAVNGRGLLASMEKLQNLKLVNTKYPGLEAYVIDSPSLDSSALPDVAKKRRDLSRSAELLLYDDNHFDSQNLFTSYPSLVKALAPDQAFVQYIKFSQYAVNPFDIPVEEYAAFILLPDGALKFVPLGEARSLDKIVQNSYIAYSQGLDDARAQIKILHDKLIAPFNSILNGKKRLIISLDSELNRIPFAALSVAGNDVDPALDGYRFDVVSSPADIVRYSSNKLRESGKQTSSVVVADPIYPAKTALISTEKKISLTRGSSRADSKRWDPLPFTRDEAKAIAPLLNASLLLGADANIRSLQGLVSPKILHIAAHAFFEPIPLDLLASNKVVVEPTSPRFLYEHYLRNSGLVLSGMSRSGDSKGQVSLFSAAEAARLSLANTEMVVLSACSTGDGITTTGNGVYGLYRSFLVSGAKSVLMSLWKVDDRATAEFMVRFYKRLKAGEPRSDALAATQKEFRDGKTGIPGWSDPYYWAAWQLVGDWRPIKGL